MILYSYAAHLRSSTYHALPLTSRAKATQIAHPTTEADLEAEQELGLEHGASNGEAGKGNLFVGRISGEEERDEADANGGDALGAGTSAAQGRSDNASSATNKQKAGKAKKEGNEDEAFSWD